jgi:hypothetical protein
MNTPVNLPALGLMAGLVISIPACTDAQTAPSRATRPAPPPSMGWLILGDSNARGCALGSSASVPQPFGVLDVLQHRWVEHPMEPYPIGPDHVLCQCGPWGLLAASQGVRFVLGGWAVHGAGARSYDESQPSWGFYRESALMVGADATHLAIWLGTNDALTVEDTERFPARLDDILTRMLQLSSGIRQVFLMGNLDPPPFDGTYRQRYEQIDHEKRTLAALRTRPGLPVYYVDMTGIPLGPEGLHPLSYEPVVERFVGLVR